MAEEPELWHKVDGYSAGTYDWMIWDPALPSDLECVWFDDEAKARDAFDALVGRKATTE